MSLSVADRHNGAIESSAAETEGPSGLASLVIAARHRGVHLSIPLLIRDHQLGPGEPSMEQVVKIARASGLKAVAAKLNFRQLGRLGTALPAIVFLRNGSAMVLVGIDYKGPIPKAALIDPGAGAQGRLVIDEPRFAEAMSGDVILVKRDYREAEAFRPFGWGMIRRQILRDRGLIRDVTVAAFLMSLLAITPIMFWRLLIDTVLNDHAFNTLYILCVIMVVLVVFETMFGYLRRYIVLFISRRVEVNLSIAIFNKLLQLPIEYFEQTTTGEIARDVSEMWKIRNFVIAELLGTLLDGMIMIVILPILFFFSVTLTLVVIGIAALIFGWLLIMMPIARRKAAAVHRAEGVKGSFMVESLFGIRTIKSLALDARRRHEWDVHVARAADLKVDEGRIQNLIQTVILPLERLMTTGVFALAVYLAMTSNDQVFIGALVAFMMLTMRLVAPLGHLAMLLPDLDEVRIAVEVIAKMVNQPPEEGRLRVGSRPPITGRVVFSEVSFRYPGSNSYALDDVSFTVPEGSIFGIVGRSGSGKTTVTRLLQMLNSSYEGLIKIDGTDLRVMDVDHLRSNIGIVLQENFLFRGTVRETIAAARSDARMEDVIRAARMAGAEEFIERLPGGYDTWIQEGSTNLSGGQRQRLAIARALITDPRVLILDEATSALDAESEAIVNANLLHIARQRTLLIISHRLSSLVGADSIMVLERGRVYDIAPHAELLTRCDIYRSLWRQQHRHLQSKPLQLDDAVPS